jgi:hypothetical protein
MANKFIFKIEETNFVITDDVDTRIEKLREPKEDLKFDKSATDVYYFKSKSDGTTKGNPNKYPFSDIIDNRTGLPFTTVDELNTFLSKNLGVTLVEVYIPPVVAPTYFKDRVVVITNSNDFNSNVPANVPGLTYTITQDGDYVLYAIVNNNNDQNEELEMYFAINGVTILDSIVFQTERKNQDDNIQGTYDITGLVDGDIVTVQLDTRGDNVDLLTRRMLIQSWELV